MKMSTAEDSTSSASNISDTKHGNEHRFTVWYKW